MGNPWKSLCLQWKRDYKSLRFAVDIYEKLKKGICDLDNLTDDERGFYTWADGMEYPLDSITEIEQAFRDYIDKNEGLYE